MGKGEELHMELEFDRDVIHCWEIAADGTLCQEETLETIVPDACPDILRIVAVCGQATLNGKQAREGAAAVSGSVRAVLLYQPEEGGGLRRMEAALPFSAQLEAPGLTEQGRVHACVRLRGAEARALNPRKVLLRADLAVDVTAFQPRERVCCQGVLEPEEHGVQQRVTEQESYQLEAVQEKPFTFSEQVRLNVGQGEPVQLAACRAVPLCGESRLIGSKLIFKGAVELQLLVQEAGGGLNACRENLPFSQIMEVPGLGEGGECRMAVELTQLSCQPAGEDGRTVEVALDLLAQAQVWSRRPVTLLQDLYSTALQTQVEREEQVLWQLVEQSSRTQNVRELLETGSLPRSVTDSWVSLGEIRRNWEGDQLVLEGEARVTILYLDENDALQALQRPLTVSCRLDAPEGARCCCRTACSGEVFAAPSAGGDRGALRSGLPIPHPPGAAHHGGVRGRPGGAPDPGRGGSALGGAPAGLAGGGPVGAGQGLRHHHRADRPGQRPGGGAAASGPDAPDPQRALTALQGVLTRHPAPAACAAGAVFGLEWRRGAVISHSLSPYSVGK